MVVPAPLRGVEPLGSAWAVGFPWSGPFVRGTIPGHTALPLSLLLQQFVVDAANPTQVSSSCVQLLSVLSAAPLASVPVLVLFNKM